MFGDITLNSNIAQYYANPFAQYFTMPNYSFFMPYQNSFGQYTPFQNFFNFGQYSYPQMPILRVKNYTPKYTPSFKPQKTFDYKSSNLWKNMGLDLSLKKSPEKDEEKVYQGTHGSLKLSKSDLNKMGFNTPDLQRRWEHLTPEFQKALVKLTKYAEENGIKISYGKRSTWRSHQDQIDLRDGLGGKVAAKPGHSPHEKGIAVDITTTSVGSNKRSNRENQALLGAYWESLGYRWGGHFKNFTKEPWHFDLKPTRS